MNGSFYSSTPSTELPSVTNMVTKAWTETAEGRGFIWAHSLKGDSPSPGKHGGRGAGQLVTLHLLLGSKEN